MSGRKHAAGLVDRTLRLKRLEERTGIPATSKMFQAAMDGDDAELDQLESACETALDMYQKAIAQTK